MKIIGLSVLKDKVINLKLAMRFTCCIFVYNGYVQKKKYNMGGFTFNPHYYGMQKAK